MEVESFDERSGESGASKHETNGSRSPLSWLKNTNHRRELVELVKRARRALPGDPDFGDPLSASGVGGPSVVARAADRLLERDAATREVSLATLQVWQALTERISGRPANAEVTLVFCDLVGFSSWALKVGDDATLKLLRRVAQVVEPPLLEAGGHIVKRMGDGSMAVFPHPGPAVRAALIAKDAVRTVEVEGYTPRIRFGVHTGRPQRLGSDWLGVDVNIAARVMERATRGGVVVSQTTLDHISDEDLDALGVTAKRVRRPLFGPHTDGMPDDLAVYRLRKAPRPVDAEPPPDDGSGA